MSVAFNVNHTQNGYDKDRRLGRGFAQRQPSGVLTPPPATPTATLAHAARAWSAIAARAALTKIATATTAAAAAALPLASALPFALVLPLAREAVGTDVAQ